MVESLAPATAIGFVAGYLSGQFGIGGGVITAPAIRMLLGGSALVSVGTPLPVIIPTSITGVIAYARRGLLDVRAGLTIGAAGAVFWRWGRSLRRPSPVLFASDGGVSSAPIPDLGPFPSLFVGEGTERSSERWGPTNKVRRSL